MKELPLHAQDDSLLGGKYFAYVQDDSGFGGELRSKL